MLAFLNFDQALHIESFRSKTSRVRLDFGQLEVLLLSRNCSSESRSRLKAVNLSRSVSLALKKGVNQEINRKVSAGIVWLRELITVASLD